MKKLILVGSLILLFAFGYAQNIVTQTFTSPGTGTFTVPAGINTVTVECWGAGGGGGGAGGSGGAGGGGGGAYSRSTLPVTPGSYTVMVGVGGPFGNGPGSNGIAGTDSWFDNTTRILAKGGTGGVNGGGGGSGIGGLASAGVGDFKFDGGMGGFGAQGGGSQGGGGGGSSAGTSSNGNIGSNGQSGGGGTGGFGGIAPANGGNGGKGGNDSAPGSVFPGLTPGGGGGGAGAESGGTFGGAGATGQVIVSYTQPTILSVDPGVSDGSYKIGDVITIGITFSDIMSVTGGTPTLSLNTSPTRSATYSSVTGSTIHFTYTIQAGDISAGLDYTTTTALVSNGASIASLPDQNIAVLTLPTPGGSGSLGANSNIVVDGIAPASPSAPALDQSDDSGISNTDNITAIDANLTMTGTAEAGTTISFYDAIIGFLGSTSATGGVYSFDVDLGSDTYSITASAEDAAGNISTASVPLNLVVDTGNPNVTINQSGAQPDPTSIVPISFDIMFDEPIDPSTFTNSDITLSGGTATGQTVSGLTTSDNINWLLTISASGAGTIIPVISNGIIEDLAGNMNTASSSTDHTVDFQVCTIPTLNTSTTDKTSCVNPNGTATVTATTGGGEPSSYTMTWYQGTIGGTVVIQNASVTDGSTGLTAFLLLPGTYAAEVINNDVAGCSNNVSVTINEATVLPNLNTSQFPNTSCLAPNGSASVIANTPGGEPAGGYDYEWLNSSLSQVGTSNTVTGLAADTYSITVTNNDTFCQGNASVTITDNTVIPNLSPSSVPNTNCGAPNGSASVNATTVGGEPAGGYTYAWFDGLSNSLGIIINTITNVAADSYTVQVTNNDSGCQSTTSETVADNTVLPTITLGTPPSVPQGTTTANLPFSGTTGSPNQYAIDFNSAAEGVGFSDVSFTTLPGTPIAITVPGGAAVGTYNASITVRNSATLCDSSPSPFTVQITAPPPPVITAVIVPNVSMKIGDLITATITVNSSAEVFTLGTSTINGYSLVNLIKSNNTTYTAQFNVLASGTDAIASASIPVSVVLTGVGGSNAPFTTAIVQAADPIDANAPAAPTIPDLNVADDTGASNTDNIINITSALTFGGTAEIGATVNIYRAGSTLIGTGVATGGSYSIDVSLTAGAHSITAIATDVAGNVGVASSGLNVNVDTTPPSVTLNQTGAQADPTSTLPVNFTAVFSEAINAGTFTSADFTLGGSAPGQTVGTLSTSDNITWTIPLNATGAGTFTPLIPAGGIQDVAGNNSNGSTSTDNSVTYSTPPTTQAINIIFSAVTGTSININWTNGNGAGRLVLARAGSAVNATPVNGTSYTVNPAFGSGTQVGAGNYVVFGGAGNSTNVTGLTPGTIYHFQVFEYNGSGATSLFLTTTATGNPASQATLSAPVITAVSIPNVAMKIASVVTATITVNSSTETFTLVAGSTIGGFSLSNLVKSNPTTYTAQFTVANGGADVVAANNIPVNITVAGLAGNSVAFTTAIAQNADPIDANAPVYSATAPTPNATVSNTQVSYTLSENLASGSIAWTRTGGTADPNSPHLQTLTGTELTAGARSNISLTNNPTLVSGAIYSIAFNGTDAAGNTATAVTNSNVTFSSDATPPTVVSIVYQIPATSPTNATSLTFRVTFSESVTGVAAADFTKTVTGASSGAISVSIVNASTYNVTIGSISGEGTVRLDVSATATINDLAGNAFTGGFTTGQVYTVDTISPVITSTAPATASIIQNASVSYTLSEAIASGSVTWTRTGGTVDGSSPHVQALSGTELSAGPHTNITLVNNPTLVNGAIYSVTFSATDAAGNTATAVTNTNITFDNSVPTVTSIVYQTPATSPTNASSLTFRVTFSEPVLNADAADFAKTLSAGVAGGAITVTPVSSSVYNVSFAVAGSGTVRLDVLGTATITDVNGNALSANFNTGQVYTLDQTPPIFSNTNPASNSIINSTQVSYTLSENLSAGTITWTRTGGTADGTVHTQDLVGTELASGTHSNIILASPPNLVAGAVYTVAFAGTDVAGNNATVVISLNVTYTPAPINLSDIVASSNFSYPQNIDFINFQENSDIQSSTTSITVAQFDIRDGGDVSTDADPFPTVITSLTLDLGTNFSLIRRIALYDATGQTEIGGTEKAVSEQTVSFNNLSISCPDNSTLSFTIRVSFVATIADNEQFSIAIKEAKSESSTSGLAAADGGGASTSSASNSNRIEVIATELKFIDQPANTLVNETMATPISIEAVDANGNRDLDFNGTVGIASSGTLDTNPSVSLNEGFGISTADIVHSVSSEGLTLTTNNTAGLTDGTSSSFDIYENTSDIELVIHSVITPTNIDDQNNVLFIENINFFPENSVQLIDRWGIPIKSWENFSNYDNAAPDQSDFDFSSLNVGNYICVVQFKDSTRGNKKSQTQMITVLK